MAKKSEIYLFSPWVFKYYSNSQTAFVIFFATSLPLGGSHDILTLPYWASYAAKMGDKHYQYHPTTIIIFDRVKWTSPQPNVSFVFAKLSFNFNYNLVESWDGYILNFPSHPPTHLEKYC